MHEYGTTSAPARRGRRHHPQQRHHQPRGDDVRPRPVHRRRRARLPHGGHALPPAGLLHRRRGRRGARGDHRRTRPRPAAPAGRRAGRRRWSTTRPRTPTRRCTGRSGSSAGTPRPARTRWRASAPHDVDVFSLYDPNSFEIIRQLEALGVCGEGEGGPLAAERRDRRGRQAPGQPRRRLSVVRVERDPADDAEGRRGRTAVARHAPCTRSRAPNWRSSATPAPARSTTR